jgi:hypothetical protein
MSSRAANRSAMTYNNENKMQTPTEKSNTVPT